MFYFSRWRTSQITCQNQITVENARNTRVANRFYSRDTRHTTLSIPIELPGKSVLRRGFSAATRHERERTGTSLSQWRPGLAESSRKRPYTDRCENARFDDSQSYGALIGARGRRSPISRSDFGRETRNTILRQPRPRISLSRSRRRNCFERRREGESDSGKLPGNLNARCHEQRARNNFRSHALHTRV